MPESDRRTELGGLARSIDALFTASASRGTATAEIDLEADGPPESDGAGDRSAEAPLSAPTAMEPDFSFEVPATGAASPAIGRVDPPAGVGEPAPDPDVSLMEVESTEIDLAEIDLTGIELADGGAAPEVVTEGPELSGEPAFDIDLAAPEMDGPDGEVGLDEAEPDLDVAAMPPLGEPAAATMEVESPSVDLEAEEFEAAVRAYIDGDHAVEARVDALAAKLRDRLALDPLADGVEALVSAGGNRPELVNRAHAVLNPAVASRLAQRMRNERDEQRLRVYNVLCQRLGRVMANALRGALTQKLEPDALRVCQDALMAMGREARPVIEEMVVDENKLLVRSGVAILGEAGGEGAGALVTSALADPDPRVRREALLALGKLGDPESGALVFACLEDPEEKVRTAAVVAAGQLGVERAVRPLIAMLDDEPTVDVAVAVLEALGRLGDPGAVIAIEKHAVRTMFSKPETEVRVAAYRALHAIGTPHAKSLLQQATEDKDPRVRTVVRSLLRAGD